MVVVRPNLAWQLHPDQSTTHARGHSAYRVTGCLGREVAEEWFLTLLERLSRLKGVDLPAILWYLDRLMV
jgi:hypothetical protein